MKLIENKHNIIIKLSQYSAFFFAVIFYIFLSSLVRDIALSDKEIKILRIGITTSALRGIITQIQMLVCVYLVLKENKAGYIISVLLNIYSMLVAIIFMVNSKSPSALPGVISYGGAFLIITLIILYKRRASAYLTEIERQRRTLIESESKLHKMAFYDALTGLPNKELYINRLEQNISLARRNGKLVGTMFIDLDSFKSVNDTMGHSAGDIVLKSVAERFENCVRKEDTVSRFGGDEYLIQICNFEKVEDLHKITKKIMDSLQQPILVNNVEFVITASVGVAVYPVDGEDPETLIKNADIAMYAAKNKGKNESVFCSPKMKKDVVKKMKLTNKLYRAMENKELYLQYQPQINVETKEIIGFEALLRWNNAEYGLISPEVFIPLTETTGMIIPIGLWVFKTVCEQCKECRKAFNKDYRVSINLSLEQLKDSNFIRQISKIIEDTNTVPEHLQIEITESIAFNQESYVLQRIKEIKDLGITISIDDFGTGHSSLSRLRTFPIDLIKIDMEFVQGISTNSHKEKEIVKSIIQLSKNLGMKVLAEGVETEEQYQFLKNEMCDEIQGFYFYKPMMPDDIKKIMIQECPIDADFNKLSE
ncbi:MAG: EAL domain-containing protein [Lachnospiraceae bacterium]|nr:EAL domain-containing protein [Lachnospiraceae bacterium]